MASFQAKIGWEGLEREKIKIIVPISSYPTRNREFQKYSKKKNKKTSLWLLFKKTGWERPRKIENKNYHSDQFLPDPL